MMNTKGISVAALLLCGGCSSLGESAYDCPRIIPQVAYDRLLSRASVRTVPVTELDAVCHADSVLGCAIPHVQNASILRADIYIADGLSEPAWQNILLHEICHLYEVDSGALAFEQTSIHQGWLAR